MKALLRSSLIALTLFAACAGVSAGLGKKALGNTQANAIPIPNLCPSCLPPAR